MQLLPTAQIHHFHHSRCQSLTVTLPTPHSSSSVKGGKTHLELLPVARKTVHTVSAHNLWPIGHFLCLRLPWVPAHLSICQLKASS